ncbi:unnamed protein product [Effrenium voratum]|nr:unnamed protein product [Effrenium voratum]
MALLSSLSLSLLREKDKPRKSEPDAKPKPKPKQEVAPSRARPEPEAQVKPPTPKPAKPASPSLPPSLPPAAPASASSDAGDSQPKAMSSLLGAYSDSEEETQVKPISSAAAAVVATAGEPTVRRFCEQRPARRARGAHGACDARLKAGRFGGQAGAANCAEGPSGESAGHHAIPQISDVRLAEALRNMKFLKRALTLSSCRKLRCVTVAAGSLAVGCYVWMACDLCLQEHVMFRAFVGPEFLVSQFLVCD